MEAGLIMECSAPTIIAMGARSSKHPECQSWSYQASSILVYHLDSVCVHVYKFNNWCSNLWVCV